MLPEDSTSHKIGQRHDAKARTQDIFIDEPITFGDIGLCHGLVKGLSKSGFEKPSPIQLSAIPYGRCGLDLVVQAKSGTGKTCVFTIIALESIKLNTKHPQVMVLAPTREIALQIEQVITSIGCQLPGLKCHSSIGGLPLKQDKENVKQAHIVIGTPGRIKQLMELSALDCSSIRLFVLDEADKLLEDSFQEQINWIYYGLPDSKQVIAASATFTEELVDHLCKYMHNPTFVRLNSNDPVLLGVTQYKMMVETSNLPAQNYKNKVTALMDILSKVNFQQCLIFSNLMTRAENLSKLMISRGWPTAHIAGCQEQNERIEAITKLKTYNCRILISTDLTSRGIDADRIDLVINLDLPYDTETYLHRVGRAGRFGAKGAAITLHTESEAVKLNGIATDINTTISPLPVKLSADFIQYPTEVDGSKKNVVQVESFQIITDKENDIEIAVCKNIESVRQCKEEVCRSQANSYGDVQAESNNIPCEQQEHEIAEMVSEMVSDHSIESQRCENEVSPVDIIYHRPPFASLEEALKFLADPEGNSDMLETTNYVNKITSQDAETVCCTRNGSSDELQTENPDEIKRKQLNNAVKLADAMSVDKNLIDELDSLAINEQQSKAEITNVISLTEDIKVTDSSSKRHQTIHKSLQEITHDTNSKECTDKSVQNCEDDNRRSHTLPQYQKKRKTKTSSELELQTLDRPPATPRSLDEGSFDSQSYNRGHQFHAISRSLDVSEKEAIHEEAVNEFKLDTYTTKSYQKDVRQYLNCEQSSNTAAHYHTYNQLISGDCYKSDRVNSEYYNDNQCDINTHYPNCHCQQNRQHENKDEYHYITIPPSHQDSYHHITIPPSHQDDHHHITIPPSHQDDHHHISIPPRHQNGYHSVATSPYCTCQIRQYQGHTVSLPNNNFAVHYRNAFMQHNYIMQMARHCNYNIKQY